jgi:Fic family protein
MRHAVTMLEKLPLSQRVIKETHKVLMQGVRGENKTPGKYRRIPNWIGQAGLTAEEARYIPPAANDVPEFMSNWEKFIHASAPDKLVQLAIIHAEFEAIHPFLDGNGRIGRLLVPLFLVSQKLLSSPDFYVSAYLEKHRDEYYDRLLAVSRDNDWTGWCAFFLTALTEQAQDNEAKAKSILALYQTKKEWIVDVTGSKHAVRALDWFFIRPIFKTTDFIASVNIPANTAYRIISIVRGQLLKEVRAASGQQAAILAFSELLNIAEGRQVF